ncbi:MAG: NAD(P)H-dependent glycerol-3-phosphate dehydrogenase [Acidobacteriota bacterium]
MSELSTTVLGAGSWGSAMAMLIARSGCPVKLWCRNPDAAEALQAKRSDERYLPGMSLPPSIEVGSDLAAAVDGAELLVSAVPSSGTREVARALREQDLRGVSWLSTSKGLEGDRLLRMSQVIDEVLPALGGYAVLSGPSFAKEVAEEQPTAVVVASEDLDLARRLQEQLSGPRFRAYASDDVVGVELGGAVKNVIAIAAGLLAGRGFGHDPLAALITRGLHELSALATALGGRPETMAGLAGLGDLVLTCTGPLSRNRRLGEAIGQGASTEQALAALGQVAEGATTARKVVELAESVGVEMPISTAVVRVLEGAKAPGDALHDLMTRSLKDERA